MTRRTYRKDEVLAEQGATLCSLFVIRTGVLIVSRNEGGIDAELSRLSPGDYFGEAGLFAGQGEPGTIKALTFAVVYEVGQAALAKLMQDRPTMADEISVTLARRAKRRRAGAGAAPEDASMRSVSWLVGRIRSAFQLPYDPTRGG
jgi:CRP-like cAMP-binding protein